MRTKEIEILPRGTLLVDVSRSEPFTQQDEERLRQSAELVNAKMEDVNYAIEELAKQAEVDLDTARHIMLDLLQKVFTISPDVKISSFDFCWQDV